MSLFESFITEGNDKADELAKEGAMMDGGGMAQIRASTVQKECEEVHAALQHAASFHCLVEEWKDCKELKPLKPSQKSELFCEPKWKQRSIVWSGVRQQAHIVARDAKRSSTSL